MVAYCRDRKQHSETLEQHTKILERHSETLAEHGEILKSHGEKIDYLSDEVRKINLTLENDVERKFGIIFDKLQGLDERMDDLVSMEEYVETQERISVLELRVREISNDVIALKKAQ